MPGLTEPVVLVVLVPPAPPVLAAVSLTAALLVVTLPLLLAPPTLLLALEVVDVAVPVVTLAALALVCDDVTEPAEVTALVLVLAVVPPMPVAGSGLLEVEHPKNDNTNVDSPKSLLCRISIARSVPCIGGQSLAFTLTWLARVLRVLSVESAGSSPNTSGTVQ